MTNEQRAEKIALIILAWQQADQMIYDAPLSPHTLKEIVDLVNEHYADDLQTTLALVDDAKLPEDLKDPIPYTFDQSQADEAQYSIQELRSGLIRELITLDASPTAIYLIEGLKRITDEEQSYHSWYVHHLATHLTQHSKTREGAEIARLLLEANSEPLFWTLLCIHAITGQEEDLVALRQIACARELAHGVLVGASHHVRLFRGSHDPSDLKKARASIDGILSWHEKSRVQRRIAGVTGLSTDYLDAFKTIASQENSFAKAIEAEATITQATIASRYTDKKRIRPNIQSGAVYLQQRELRLLLKGLDTISPRWARVLKERTSL